MIIRKQFPKFLAPWCIAFEKSVGAVIFCTIHGKVEFLVMKYRGGHWEFPRGRVEQDETELDTMKREVKEETGISQLRTVKGFRKTTRFSYKAQGQELIDRKKDKNCIYVHKKVVFYLAEVIDKNVNISHEHQKFQWLSFEDAYKKVTYKNAKKILMQVHKYL